MADANKNKLPEALTKLPKEKQAKELLKALSLAMAGKRAAAKKKE